MMLLPHNGMCTDRHLLDKFKIYFFRFLRRLSSQQIEKGSRLCLGLLICAKEELQSDGSLNLEFQRWVHSPMSIPFTNSKLQSGSRVVVSVDRDFDAGRLRKDVQRFYILSGFIRDIQETKIVINSKTGLEYFANNGDFCPGIMPAFPGAHFPPFSEFHLPES